MDKKNSQLISCTAQFIFFDIGVRLTADDPSIVESFRSLYKNFSSHYIPDTCITCYIQSGSAQQGPVVIINDSVRYPLPQDGAILGHADMLLFRHVFEELDSSILFHAGVVEKDGRGFVILAPSGFGKTTLALELVSRGYRFLSDEFCPISQHDQVITPFPRRLGIARSNLFFSRVPMARAVYLEFEKKYVIDCDELFPGSAGSACRPACIIQLSADMPRDAKTPPVRYVDVLLLEENADFYMALQSLPQMSIVKTLSFGQYPGYRLKIESGRAAAQRCDELFAAFSRSILYVSVIPQTRPDFTGQPDLQEMPASAAVLDIAAQVVNRSPTGKLMSRYRGKVFSLVADVGKAISGARCFSLRPGALSKMADLIDTL